MAILRLTGDVSGHCDLAAANVANSVSVTMPTYSGNLVATGYGTIVANGSLLIGNTVSGGYDANTLIAGDAITITNGRGTINIALAATGDVYARERANGAFLRANIAATSGGGTINLTPAFAQLSSNVSQLPANTNAVRVNFDTQDVLSGLTHTIGNTGIFVTSNGLYQIIIAAQVSRSGGAAKQRADYWFRKNGVDIANSSVGMTMEANNDIDVLVNKYALELVANDYIEVMQAVEDSTISMGLTRSVSLDGGPVRPAITFTMMKIITAVATPAYGSSTLNFGSPPGNNDTTLVVTGQTLLPANAHIQVYIQGNDGTADHTAFEHGILSTYIVCFVSDVIAGTGFTITMMSRLRLTGQMTVRWRWS